MNPFWPEVSNYCFGRGIEDAWPRLRAEVLKEIGDPDAEIVISHPAFVAVMERQWLFDNYFLV